MINPKSIENLETRRKEEERISNKFKKRNRIVKGISSGLYGIGSLLFLGYANHVISRNNELFKSPEHGEYIEAKTALSTIVNYRDHTQSQLQTLYDSQLPHSMNEVIWQEKQKLDTLDRVISDLTSKVIEMEASPTIQAANLEHEKETKTLLNSLFLWMVYAIATLGGGNYLGSRNGKKRREELQRMYNQYPIDIN